MRQAAPDDGNPPVESDMLREALATVEAMVKRILRE
jgi:hypothetical protein